MDTVEGVDQQNGEWIFGSQLRRRGEERKKNNTTGDGMGPTKKRDPSYTGERKEREESDNAKHQSKGTSQS